MNKYEVQKPFSTELFDWDINFHGILLADKTRMKAFKNAIIETIQPGDVVLDLGIGTGILSQWAFEAGASTVYGIDFNDKILNIAKEKLRKYGKNFKPILGNSLNLDLPEKVDVIISETIGNFADNENCVLYLKDAKKRFLKENGKMIPQKIEQWFVPVYTPIVKTNIKNLDTIKNYYETVIPKSDYMSKPQKINTFYLDEEDKVDYKINVAFELAHNKKITGFKGWFNAKLSQNITLSNEIADNDSSWNNFYIPFSETEINNLLKINLENNNLNYIIKQER